MKLEKLLNTIEPLDLINFRDDICIESLAYHSAKVKANGLYFAIKGYLTDGHNYIGQAVSNGAVAVVVQEIQEGFEGLCQIKVSDSRVALSRLSAEFYGNPSRDMDVIGVTATNGKTTTTFILDSIYENAGYRTGIIGSILTKINDKRELAYLTTPESLDLQRIFSDMKNENTEKVVMEVSSSALELSRVNDVDFDIVSFNNFSREHIDQHGSYERYWQVKSSLVKNAKPDATAVLNIDNDKIRSLQNSTLARVITISVKGNKAMINCSDLKLEKGRGVFKVAIDKDILIGDKTIAKGTYPIKMKIPGYHSVENAMAAISIALSDGISMEDIVEGIEKFPGVERRFEFIYEKGYTVIDDHFANVKNINSTMETIGDMEKNKVHIAYAIRGNRGVTVNRENAEALVYWMKKLEIDQVIATRSLGSVTDKDRVAREEELAFSQVMERENINYRIVDSLQESIRLTLEKTEYGDIVLLAGCQGMDRGARLAFDNILTLDPTEDPKDLYRPLERRVSEEVCNL